MGCNSCSSGGGKPNGCRTNGTCSTSGCNKLEVYDWLANIDLPGGQQPYDILEVRFKNSRKDFFRNSEKLNLQVGDIVVVNATSGVDVGLVSIVGELARIQVSKKTKDFKPLECRKIVRIANQKDIDLWIKARSKEQEIMYKARTLAMNIGLQMKISDVEYQGDMSKATFYYTAEGRVDFRQLIKDLAGEFRMRIEMKQIGSRQESSRLGGIGSCGRELCCSTWLTDFRSVSTSAARYQQLSLNPQKLAGQCGKLKCCLNFELDAYLDGLKGFPKSDIRLKTKKGDAYHVKTDVFKHTMWYTYRGENEFIPLKPERVKEIIESNKKGEKPSDLKDFQIREEVIEEEVGYSNVVGQDSVNRFEKTFNKGKKKNQRRKKKPSQSK
ncbi:MAG: regulatory iron-sulfur-containing complex subunit RicT [Crocinitomicaceae bacterium]